jgi:hypothetical protein
MTQEYFPNSSELLMLFPSVLLPVSSHSSFLPRQFYFHSGKVSACSLHSKNFRTGITAEYGINVLRGGIHVVRVHTASHTSVLALYTK